MDDLNSWGVGWNDPFMGSTAYGTQEARYDATLPSASLGGTNSVPSFSPLSNGFNAPPPSVGMGQASASPQPISQPSAQASAQPSTPQQSTAPPPPQQQPWNTPQFWDNFSSWAQQQPWDQSGTWDNFGSTMQGLFSATSGQSGGQSNPNTNFQNGYLQSPSTGTSVNSATSPQGGLNQMQTYTGP